MQQMEAEPETNEHIFSPVVPGDLILGSEDQTTLGSFSCFSCDQLEATLVHRRVRGACVETEK